MIPNAKEEEKEKESPLATVSKTLKAHCNNDERALDRQPNGGGSSSSRSCLVADRGADLEAESRVRQTPRSTARDPAPRSPLTLIGAQPLEAPEAANMTPGDSRANYSGSQLHNNEPPGEPEQLHKEPESAGRSAQCSASESDPLRAPRSSRRTVIDISHINKLSQEPKEEAEKNIPETLGGMNDERSVFRVDCAAESDALTSIFAHVDEVKKELDFLASSTLAPTATVESTISRKHQQQVATGKGEPDATPITSPLVGELPTPGVGLSMRDSSVASSSSTSTSGSSSATDSIPTRKLSREEDFTDYTTDDLRSLSGSSQGSELYRSTSVASYATVNEMLAENFSDLLASSSEQQYVQDNKRKQTSHTIFILQHLMRKRNELRSIDRQLYQMITQYLIQLDMTPQQYRERGCSGEAPTPTVSPELSGLERLSLMATTCGRQVKTPSNEATRRVDEAIDLTSTMRTGPNAAIDENDTPIQEMDLEESKFIRDPTPATGTNDTAAGGLTKPAQSANTAANQIGKQQPTVNLKKSRLLGAINWSTESRVTPKSAAVAGTQESSTYTDTGGGGGGGIGGSNYESPATLHQHQQTRPLNLLKRYWTPPPAPQPLFYSQNTMADMSAAAAATSPTAALVTSGVAKLEQNSHNSDNHDSSHISSQPSVVLAPVTPQPPPAVVISPVAALHHLDLNHQHHQYHHHHHHHHRHPRQPTPEALHLPLHKKFRSVAQMIDPESPTDSYLRHQATTANYYGVLSRHYRGNGLLGLSPSAALLPIGYEQTPSYLPAPASHQQEQRYSIPPACDDGSLAHRLNYDCVTQNAPTDDCCNKFLAPAVACVPTDGHQLSPPGHLMSPLDNPPNSIYHTVTISSAHLAAHESLKLVRTAKEPHPQQQQLTPVLARLMPPRGDLLKSGYKCHVCGSGFEDRHRLQQHLSIHLVLHPSWYEEKTIKETMARYESKRGDYMCESCNQRFETTSEFDRHMHLHREKPHLCELCTQDNKMVSFRYYRQLLTHLRSHCFLYSCRFTPECKQTANRKDYLKLHILKHHLNNKLPEQYTVCCH